MKQITFATAMCMFLLVSSSMYAQTRVYTKPTKDSVQVYSRNGQLHVTVDNPVTPLPVPTTVKIDGTTQEGGWLLSRIRNEQFEYKTVIIKVETTGGGQGKDNLGTLTTAGGAYWELVSVIPLDKVDEGHMNVLCFLKQRQFPPTK